MKRSGLQVQPAAHGLSPELYDELKPQFLFATLGALAIGVAYLPLPEELTLGPNWLVLAVDAVVLLPLLYTVYFHPLPHRVGRAIRTALQVVLTIALVASIVLLVTHLSAVTAGGLLLRSAALLWISNVLIFAVWYWELDGDGPVQRHKRGHAAGDFLFPQQARGTAFVARYVDYLFLAFGFATALSPADTAPLSARAKLFMMAEALCSMTIIVLLVGRSVNII